MHQILFVQGAGKDVHEQWDSKLVDSLRRELGTGYEVRYPRMPNEADPQAAAWGVAIESAIAALQRGTIVVGHSIGGAILINVLTEHAPAVDLGAIVLIAAPFIGHGGWESEDIEPRSDLAERLPRGVPVLLYHGDKDTTVPIVHAALYAAAIPHANVRKLANRDHQLNNDLSDVANDIRELAANATRPRDSESDERRAMLAELERELSDLERRCDEHRHVMEAAAREAREWENRAMQAINEGHDDVAQQALIHLQRYAAPAELAAVEAIGLEAARDAYRNAVAAVRATIGSMRADT